MWIMSMNEYSRSRIPSGYLHSRQRHAFLRNTGSAGRRRKRPPNFCWYPGSIWKITNLLSQSKLGVTRQRTKDQVTNNLLRGNDPPSVQVRCILRGRYFRAVGRRRGKAVWNLWNLYEKFGNATPVEE